MANLTPDRLPSRMKYLTSSQDVNDIVRSTITLHRLLDNGLPEEAPVEIADMLHIQSISVPDEERIQISVDSADDGKVYIFGRQARVYSVSCFLVDSNQDSRVGSAIDQAFGGNLLTRWLEFYEDQFRFTKCLERGYIVRIRWRNSEYWGYILSNARTIESTNPSVIPISFTFAHIFGEEHMNFDVLDPQNGYPSFPVMISREGYQHLMNYIATDPWIGEPASAVSRHSEGRTSVPSNAGPVNPDLVPVFNEEDLG